MPRFTGDRALNDEEAEFLDRFRAKANELDVLIDEARARSSSYGPDREDFFSEAARSLFLSVAWMTAGINSEGEIPPTEPEPFAKVAKVFTSITGDSRYRVVCEDGTQYAMMRLDEATSLAEEINAKRGQREPT